MRPSAGYQSSWSSSLLRRCGPCSTNKRRSPATLLFHSLERVLSGAVPLVGRPLYMGHCTAGDEPTLV